MFILTKISDLVQLPPGELGKPSAGAIEDYLNKKYANKVMQRIGLCVCMYDLLSATDGVVGHGTGILNVNVIFRLLIFRPFKHEVILGMISSSSPSGIKIRIGDFFDEITVPTSEFPENCSFNHNDQLWVWEVEDTRLFYDTGEMVRFRVHSEHWFDQSPAGPMEGKNAVDIRSPYTIIASLDGAGLGPVGWWDGGDTEEA